MSNPWRIRQQVDKLESDAETLAAIKLRRARGRASQGMLALCDMLEHRLKEEDGRAPKFDRTPYQRQYMRDRRAAAKPDNAQKLDPLEVGVDEDGIPSRAAWSCL
jgi:hypothetical protein